MVNISITEHHYTPAQFGSVPRLYSETDIVFVSGGGPSLPADLSRIKNRVAATNSGLDHPGAQILFWSDLRWYGWNRERVDRFPGLKFTRSRPEIRGDINRLRYRPGLGLSEDADCVSGQDSGSGALNVAYLAGGRDFVLIGMDMRESADWRADNYHSDHQAGPAPGRMTRVALPAFDRMGAMLAARGCRVRVVGDSALSFAKVEFDAACDEADGRVREGLARKAAALGEQ